MAALVLVCSLLISTTLCSNGKHFFFFGKSQFDRKCRQMSTAGIGFQTLGVVRRSVTDRWLDFKCHGCESRLELQTLSYFLFCTHKVRRE